MSYNSIFGYGSHSPHPSLQGHWLMDDNETSSVVLDRSGNGNHGVLIDGSGQPYNTSEVSTVGPTSWLPSGFDFTDHARIVRVEGIDDSPNVYAGLFIADGTANAYSRIIGKVSNASPGGWFIGKSTSNSRALRGSVSGPPSYATLFNSQSSSNWNHIASNFYEGSTYNIFNGVLDASGPSASISSTSARFTIGGDDDPSGLDFFRGKVAGAFLFSDISAIGEGLDEIYAGPEPLNLVAPTISGDTAAGSTLTCDPGTWDSQDNGVITYSYQWTADGIDISGATSSTYTTQVEQVGEAIRCRVRASNDGGYDDAEDTLSNSITVTAAAPSFKPWFAQRRTQLIGMGI